ncbi:hypothetical protein ACH41E_28215 [Streptomyces sp. NPDC020412]|uniref:hypothetical protein n=1 Tax=Streptomyces sp. NPDC020412 TaxID=3365073 RepID=UPI0037B77391
MKSARFRRVLPVALALTLAVVVVVAGATYLAVTAGGADRSAPTKVWDQAQGKLPDDPAGDLDRGRSDTPLSKLLLPAPYGYRLGPDRMTSDGNDGELSGPQALERFKRTGGGLTGSERREFERNVERMGVEGVAWRTYVYEREFQAVGVDVDVVRMADGRKSRGLYAVQTALVEALEVPKGPKVDGHRKNTACYVVHDSPLFASGGEYEDYELREFVCYGYAGTDYVFMRTYGNNHLTPSDASDFMKQQMDHLTIRREAV